METEAEMEMGAGMENGSGLFLNAIGYGVPLFYSSSYEITIAWLVLIFASVGLA